MGLRIWLSLEKTGGNSLRWPRPTPPRESFADRLQSIPKPVLYLILSSPPADSAVHDIPCPNEPLPESKSTLRQPDGPQGGRQGPPRVRLDQLDARREQRRVRRRSSASSCARRSRFAIYSAADAQAPKVARDEIRVINDLEKAAGASRTLSPFEDYVGDGLLPQRRGHDSSASRHERPGDLRGPQGLPAGLSRPRDVPGVAGVQGSEERSPTSST